MFTFLKRLFTYKKSNEEIYNEYFTKRDVIDSEYEQLHNKLYEPYRVEMMGQPVKEFFDKIDARLKIVKDEYEAKLIALDKEYEAVITEHKARLEAIEKEDKRKVTL
jgi:hypothetical protein